MAKLHLSLAGEGRGHAARAQPVGERLQHEHAVTFWTGGDALPLLEAAFPAGGASCVRGLEVPRFSYRADGRLSYARTSVRALAYLAGLPGRVRQLEAELRKDRADLAIADLEPALPRAARRVGIPYVSLSHQRLLVCGDFSFLPRALQRRVHALATTVRWLAPEGDRTIVSSFYAPPLRSSHEHVRSVGVLLRGDVLDADPSKEGHLVAYFRRAPQERLLDALAAAGREVRVYGAGPRPDDGPLRFRPLDARAFAADLAAAEGLISNAGNQLLGEARHLGKPVLAVPEAGNFEQVVNAHLLALSGAGAWVSPERLDGALVSAFVESLGDMAGRIDREGADGTPAVLDCLGELLDGLPEGLPEGADREPGPSKAARRGPRPRSEPVGLDVTQGAA